MENYNIQKLQELLQDFYNLTNIKICIYDSSENELCYYPQKLSPFCALLRNDKVLDEKCKQCDKLAFATCKKTYKQHTYVCHAGLLECISPVIYDKKIIGYIVAGQIKTSDGEFEKIAQRFPLGSRSKLAEYYEQLPHTDMKKLNSAIRILDACTGYEYLKSFISTAENKIDVRISGYINDNLTNDLSVQSVCSRFHLSHSEIYSIFKEYFHSTPAEYIKNRRIYKACELLTTTSLPVSRIAQLCGIPDYNYFSKIFKREFGISPRDYRKKQSAPQEVL